MVTQVDNNIRTVFTDSFTSPSEMLLWGIWLALSVWDY
jgi:hypothetical protein